MEDLYQSRDVPIVKFWEYGPWLYYTDQPENLSYPRYYRQRNPFVGFVRSQSDELILDYNLFISPNESYFAAGIFEVSADGNLLAFGYDLKGNEEFILKIRDLTSGENIHVPEIYTYYSVRWYTANNTDWIYYNVVNQGIPREIRRLCIRNCSVYNEAELVYVESDLSMTTELKLTSDLEYLFIKCAGQISSEYLLVTDTSLLKMFTRDQNVMYDMEHHNNSFIIRLNDPPFINNRVVQISADNIFQRSGNLSILEVDLLSPITIYENSAEFVEMHEVFERHLVLWIRKDGLREILIFGLPYDKSSRTNRITFRRENDESSESYAVFPGTIDDLESRLYRSYVSSYLTFTNSSFSKTPATFWYSLEEKQIVAHTEQKVHSEYLERRVWIKSKSSDLFIPVTIISLRDLSRYHLPTVVNSYGSYGTFKDPSYNSDLFPLIDRKTVFALCHPRGDGDLGAQWYLNGKFEKKINTFMDTQDCIDGLIEMGMSSIGKIGLLTRSAGGLIAGYSINHPKNISVVVTQVPFIDPIGDLIDETVPWTVYEYFEWGNPLKNETILKAMLEYSPYHNIQSREYPAVMVTAGIQDSRVPFWEPVKFVAKLRSSSNSSSIILKVNNEGHISHAKTELAEIYSFLLSNLAY